MPKLTRRPPRRHRWMLLLLAAQLVTGPWTPAMAQVRLPALGESASNEFDLSQEKRIGEQIMREIRPDPDYLDDPVLLAQLQQLWQPLVQAARNRGDIGADTAKLFPYEAFLVRDRSVNAFALPGGYVGVHLGLIAMTQTSDELASVLAHELSHVTQRHIARSVSAQSRASALGLAGILLGLLMASRASNADAAQAVIAGGQAAMVQSQLNFSRDMEREADRHGQDLMSVAGYSPAGMVSMFDKLDQNSRLNDSGGFPYLRSHPLTVDRIGEARQRVESGVTLAMPVAPTSLAEPGAAPPAAPSALWHQLLQMRARVLMDPSVQALQRLQSLEQQAQRADLPWARRLVAHAGAALASTQLRDFARAEVSAQALMAMMATPASTPAGAAAQAMDGPTRAVLQQLLAQVALSRGDVASARQALLPLSDDKSRPAIFLRGQLAAAENTPQALRQGDQALQVWLADHPQDAGAWQLLAQLHQRQGHDLRAVRAEAEAQAAIGNLQGAIDRLRAAQQLARKSAANTDFIEASVVDARLRDLQSQRRQLLAEQRPTRGQRRSDDTSD